MAWPYSTNCHAILPDIFEKLRYLVVKSGCVLLRFFAVPRSSIQSTRRWCYQLAGPVLNIALHVSQLRPRLHDPRLGGQGRPPNGPEEDYQSGSCRPIGVLVVYSQVGAGDTCR